MIGLVYLHLQKFLLGAFLLSLMLMLGLRFSALPGVAKRFEPLVSPAFPQLSPPNIQSSGNNSIEGCAEKKDSPSRADCFFQNIAAVLQNQQDWSHWTAVPAAGLDSLNCSPPTVGKLPESFLESFMILTRLPSQDTALDEPPLRSTQTPAESASTTSGASGRNVSSISGIFFNENARGYLCGLGQPQEPARFSRTLTSAASASHQQPIDFEPAPIVFVKPLWYLVPINPGKEKIPVWDADTSLHGTTGTGLSNWKTSVSIDESNHSTCQFKYTGWDRSTPIPLSCFFSLDLTDAQCEQVVKQSGTVQEEPPIDIGPAGCHLVLMALNLSAKIGKLWTWQTYWWSSRAEDDSSADLTRRVTPPSPDGRWRFYVMDTADSHSLYNPYLEGVHLGGTKSNCSSCHAKALFQSLSPQSPQPAASSQKDTLLLCLFRRQSNITSQPDSCTLGTASVQSINTDSVWSLADVNVPLTSRGNGSR